MPAHSLQEQRLTSSHVQQLFTTSPCQISARIQDGLFIEMGELSSDSLIPLTILLVRSQQVTTASYKHNWLGAVF